MSDNRFSIIVPWKSGNPVREDHLKNMLNCLKVQEDHVDFDLIVVEQVYNRDLQRAKDKFLEILPQELCGRYRYIQLEHDTLFNKSWCMNVGARHALHNNLLFIDADSLFGPDYLKTIMNWIANTPDHRDKIIVCYNYIACMPGKDNPITRYMTPAAIRTLGGIWYAQKDFYFNKFGGMNENFYGYGAEDNEAYERAIHTMRINSLEFVLYPIIHQYHDWESPSKDAVRYFNLCVGNSEIIRARLIQANVGKQDKPTPIEISDLREK